MTFVWERLALAGEHFGSQAVLRMELAGTVGRTRLVELRTDRQGGFRRTILAPTAVPPDSYRLIAVAADGDEIASVDVTVVEPGTASAPNQARQEGSPTARPLSLIRPKSPWVTGGALAMVALAFVGGVLLLRQPSSHMTTHLHQGGHQ